MAVAPVIIAASAKHTATVRCKFKNSVINEVIINGKLF